MISVLLRIPSSGDFLPLCDPEFEDSRAHPCVEGVCGPGAECEDVGGCPECQCLPGHHGDPNTGCIAGDENCEENSDCDSQLVCEDYKCVDPCTALPRLCGQGADCTVQNHVAVCRCPEETTGDPNDGDCRTTTTTTTPTTTTTTTTTSTSTTITPATTETNQHTTATNVTATIVVMTTKLSSTSGTTTKSSVIEALPEKQKCEAEKVYLDGTGWLELTRKVSFDMLQPFIDFSYRFFHTSRT